MMMHQRAYSCNYIHPMIEAVVRNAVIGGVLTSIATTLFLLVHNHRLNLSDILWAMASFRPKWLPQYLPVVAGIFFVSGVLFLSLRYEDSNGFQPFGASSQILARTSMYGFAVGGFLIGLGSKLAGGDFIYHGLVGIGRLNCKSISVFACMLVMAICMGALLQGGNLGFLTDMTINPPMNFMHTMSAIINLGLTAVLMIISGAWMWSIEGEITIVAKKMLSSFVAGVLLGIGFSGAGMAVRSTFLSGITVTAWSPALLIFISVSITCNALTYHFLLKKVVLREDQVNQNTLFTEQQHDQMTFKAAIGGLLFGCGWGIAGLDLTTYFIHSAIFTVPVVVIFGLYLIIGTMIGDTISS